MFDRTAGEVSKSTTLVWSFTAKQGCCILPNYWGRWRLVLRGHKNNLKQSWNGSIQFIHCNPSLLKTVFITLFKRLLGYARGAAWSQKFFFYFFFFISFCFRSIPHQPQLSRRNASPLFCFEALGMFCGLYFGYWVHFHFSVNLSFMFF